MDVQYDETAETLASEPRPISPDNSTMEKLTFLSEVIIQNQYGGNIGWSKKGIHPDVRLIIDVKFAVGLKPMLDEENFDNNLIAKLNHVAEVQTTVHPLTKVYTNLFLTNS